MRAPFKASVTTLLAALLFAVPVFALAAANTLQDFIGTLTGIVLLAVPFAFALLAFFWNLAQLLLTLGDAEKVKQARSRMVWSVIALFVLFTVAGIVGVLQRSIFGTSTERGGIAPTAEQAATPHA